MVFGGGEGSGRQQASMIPPRGFKNEVYPLRHRLPFSCSLSPAYETSNTVFFPIVMSSNEMDVAPGTIQVNPHNTNYEEDGGPLVRQMSIIDKMRISLKFNLLEDAADAAHTSGQSGAEAFSGDGIQAIHCLWRPIFGCFPEKLDATDDDTGTTVAAILGLTKDATFEDVVPITTDKLDTGGVSDLSLPVSTVNAVQVFGDFNMTTNTTMENQDYDEDLLHTALRRYTNKGALRSMLGTTRHFTLTRNNPTRNYFLDKFVPRAIRRVMPYCFMGIQVHIPFITDVEQTYHSTNIASGALVGVKCLANYHEWNAEHDQDMNP